MSSIDNIDDNSLQEILHQLSIPEMVSSALVSRSWSEQLRPLALRRRTLAIKFSNDITCDYSEVPRKLTELDYNTVQLQLFSTKYARQLRATFANIETLVMDFNGLKEVESEIIGAHNLLHPLELLLSELGNSLKTVKINLAQSVTGKIVEEIDIFNALNRMPQLKVLEISGEWDSELMDSIPQYLKLSFISQLRELHLKFKDKDDYLIEDVLGYLQPVTDNPNCPLKVIDIRLPVQYIDQLHAIFELPASLTSKVTYLDIRGNWPLYENKFMNDDWHRVTTVFTNLQTLKFSPFSFNSIANLTYALSPLKQLKVLKLCSSQLVSPLQNVLPNKGSENDANEPQMISPLTSVTELYLDFSQLIPRPDPISHLYLQQLQWSTAFPQLTVVSVVVEANDCYYCQWLPLPVRSRRLQRAKRQNFTQQMYSAVKEAWVTEELTRLHRCAHHLIRPFVPCTQLSEVTVSHVLDTGNQTYSKYSKLYALSNENILEDDEEIEAKNWVVQWEIDDDDDDD